MKLTKKDIEYQLSRINCCYGARLVGKKFFGLMCKELWKYKDIEEELGIDLITLFNALRNGVYYRMSSGQITKDYVFLISNNMNIGQVSKLDYSFMTCFEKHTLLFADYGKTWALTKEELEK